MYSAFVKRRTPRVRLTVNDDVVDSSIETSLFLCVDDLFILLLLINHGKGYLLAIAQDLLRGAWSSAKVNFQFCLCRTSSSSCEARCSTLCAKASSGRSCTCYEGLASHQTVARATHNAPSSRKAPFLVATLSAPLRGHRHCCSHDAWRRNGWQRNTKPTNNF